MHSNSKFYHKFFRLFFVALFVFCSTVFSNSIRSVIAQVVINEIGVMPQTDGTSAQFQSMYNTTANFGAEFIELYNAGCTSVNIGCWSIGGMDGGLNGGVFSIPAGTTIGPHAFLTLGGPIAGGVTFNLSSYLPANGTANLWGSGAARWHLPNGDGWIILFNNAASFVDGVYWTFEGNNPGKINTDGTYVSTMTRPSACGGGTLSGALTHSASMEYVPFSTTIGQSFARTTDGGSGWMKDATPTLGSTNATFVPCPLPVELLYFQAELKNENVDLSWQTASERENDYFIVERSNDGFNWEFLDKVEGAGNSNELLSYRAFDFHPYRGVGYYRLKQVDFDGKSSYSDVRSVFNTNDLMILPNPSRGIFGIGGLPKHRENSIVVLDFTGKMIEQQTTEEESFQLDLTHCSPGIYFVFINETDMIKLIKE